MKQFFNAVNLSFALATVLCIHTSCKHKLELHILLSAINQTDSNNFLLPFKTNENSYKLWRPNIAYHQLRDSSNVETLWHGDPFIHPRGLMIDPDSTAIWISDPGEPETDSVNKAARIIKIPIINGKPGKPRIFYSKPGFLISAKWAVPVYYHGKKVLLIADQGKGTSEYTFTGEGAKLFTIPILPNGNPGNPEMIWEGSPFKCPTGVVVVGNYIYITDPCAGPVQKTKDGYTYPTSAVFAVSIDGSHEPSTLLSGPPFTSLIGICPLVPGFLIFNDTDSGRPEPEHAGGRPGFAPPGSADRWVVQILDSVHPKLSKPERTLFTEQGNVELEIGGLIEARQRGLIKTNDQIQIEGLNGTSVIAEKAPTSSFVLTVKKLFENIDTKQSDQSVKTRLVIASDVMRDTIYLKIKVPGFPDQIVTLPKDPNRGNLFRDNKHGGARRREELGGGGPVYDRFTVDNSRGHGAVYIYPDAGGTPVAIASGPPLGRPLGGQLAPGGKLLWVTDQQAASLFQIHFPLPEEFDSIYGHQKSIRK